jgi:acyl-CoA thioesterase FadM
MPNLMEARVMDGFSFQFSYRVGVADINYGGHVANSAVLNFFRMPGLLIWRTLDPILK